jgi:subtilase family serine protease
VRRITGWGTIALAAAASSLAIAAAAGATAATAAAATTRTGPARAAIAGTKPAWVTAKDQVRSATARAVASEGTVTANVYLAGRNPSGLTAFSSAVSTPGNALYGHYLTARRTMARFGPSKAEIAAVEGWLTGSGLAVTKVSDAIGGYVQVRGTPAAASRAFDVTFGAYREDGATVRGPQQTASAPAGIAADVLDVSGLDTASHLAKPYDTLPPPGQNYWTAGPCSTYYGQKVALTEPKAYGVSQPYNNCGYTPRQVRGAYGVTLSGMTGRGQTVAVVDAYAAPTMLSDANEYAQVTGDRPFAPGQYTQDLSSTWEYTAPDECDASSWYGEESLDVEAVHGMAPNANVVYVGAASCADSDLLAALTLIVDNHLASIVTDSWGEPYDGATLVSTYDELFQAGAAEGIGFFFSAGDSGYESPAEDAGSDRVQVDWPDSSPYVTSVGGTSLAIGRLDNYEFETSWGTLLDPLSSTGTSWQYPPPGVYPDYYDGSGGGGVSTAFTQPAYQAGVVPSSLATALPNGTTSSAPMRVTPDVAALADPSTGFLVGQTLYQPDGTTLAFSLSRAGGTSLASPTFAGIEADAQQAAGHPLGFADPQIYRLHGTLAFHDVTDHPLGSGSLAEVRQDYTDPYTETGPLVTYLRTLGIDGEGAAALPAVRGYDDATGVGSPQLYVEALEFPRLFTRR